MFFYFYIFSEIQIVGGQQKENRLDKLLQHIWQYRILIIDDIGYLPVDKQGSKVLLE